MKSLLLRIAALGGVAVLGCIAIANAQRGSDDENLLTVNTPAAVNPLRAPDPMPPLRTSSRPTQQVESPASPPPDLPIAAETEPTARPTAPSTARAARRAAADPFGLQARRAGNAAAPPVSHPPINTSIPDASAAGLAVADNASVPSRYAPVASPVSVEQPATGPALTSNATGAVDDARAPRDRRRQIEDHRASASSDGTNVANTSANQEPAPFRADPFALPANSARPAASNSDDRSDPIANQNTSEVTPENQRTENQGTGNEGTGQPGARQLEGAQTPQLTIEKSAPKEIQVGKPVAFRITVRNTGTIAAGEVEIHDLVPKGTRLLGTAPQATRGENGDIVWSLATLPPGEERSVEMQLMPLAEGEIGSVATVHFGASATARTIATRPQLVVEASGPQSVLIGEQAVLQITVSNPGTGVASGVVLEERIPPGLQHPAGAELEYEVGDLKPGESRKLELALTAHRPGPAVNLLCVRGNGNLRAEHKSELEVLAPQLDVAVDGPKRRYLERQATYELSVTNPGTAAAKQVELLANLPRGLKFVSANNAGYYEESTRTVRWRLEELPPRETGSVRLVTMPIEAGQHALKLRGTAEKGLAIEKEQPVTIEGLAAILFQVADTADPIEVGGETSYEVRVVNQGSKAAANVRLAVIVPPELKAVAADGPSRHAIDSDRVVFDSFALLAPKAETVYHIRAKSLRPGDLRVRFQLLTDDMKLPVMKEESTRVYADE
jgi:uncharacterized repeat protein (TIGR01451 family)